MRNIKYLILVMIIFSFGCNNDDDDVISENEQEAFLEVLQGSWTANEVRKDNSVFSDFNNFRLTISGKSFTSENGGPVWPSSGSFDFENEEAINGFIRSDNRLFNAVENNGILTITIIYEESTARGEFGTYEFEMQQ